MELQELKSLPMTELERQLKRHLYKIPDIENRNLSSEELSDYIQMLMKEYGALFKGRYSSADIRSFTTALESNLLTKKLLEDQNASAFSDWVKGLSFQKESRHVNAGQDVSINRMIRFMPAHWHTSEYFEMYYAFSGSCPICFSDEKIILQNGTLLIVAPGTEHAAPCYADDDVLLTYVIRSSTFDDVFWNQLPQNNIMSSFFSMALNSKEGPGYLCFETNNDPKIATMLTEIYNEYHDEKPYQKQMLNLLVSQFLLTLLREHESHIILPIRKSFHWKKDFSSIFSYIQNNFASVSLPVLSEKFNYSEKQISRIILKYTGGTFTDLIQKLRMGKAAELIKQGYSLCDVYKYTGYSSNSSFYRSFKKYYGINPGQM